MYTDEQIGTLTFTGDPARFVATERVPVSGLSMDFAPVQDLHGYEYPWPAGGGKNLIDYLACSGIGKRDGTETDDYPDKHSISGSILTISLSYSQNGAVLKGIHHPKLESGQSVTISGKFKCTGSTIVLGVARYTGGTGTQIDTNVPVTPNTWVSVSKTFTLTEEFDQSAIFVQPQAPDTVLEIENLQLERGSAPTSYAPYSNICPITGRDSVTVFVSPEPYVVDGTKVYPIEFPVQGKNLFDKNTITNNQYFNGTELKPSSAAFVSDFIKINPNTDYYTNAYGTGYFYIVYLFDSNKEVVGRAGSLTNAGTFNTGDASYVRINSVKAQTSADELYLVQGSTPTTYEPYKGRTVYAGTLTINEDGSGTIVSTMAMVDLGEQPWITAPGGRHTIDSSSIIKTTIKQIDNGTLMHGYCTDYKLVIGNQVANNDMSIGQINLNTVQVNDSRYNGIDNSTFKSAMSGVQLVYELAEPVTLQLDPIEITTLIGLNYVWSSDHNLITITFPYRKEIQPMAMNYDFCWTYPKAYIDNWKPELQHWRQQQKQKPHLLCQ